MGETRAKADDAWPVSWDAARRAQRRDMAAAPPQLRLVWLEQALRLAQASGALARMDTAARRRRRGIG
jgi:hypothetical protein